MLRHPVSSNHYYVIAMNWMEAALSLNRILFRLPRFRGASYEDGVDENSSDQFLKANHNHNKKRHFDQTVMSNKLVEMNVEGYNISII
jgi:hypothetical protein